MPRQANGNYLPPANTAAVSGTTISSSAYNTLETDIGTEITNSVDRLGRSAMQAALPMGGNKVTGAADPTASTDLATKNYVDTSTATFFGTGDIKFTLKTTPDSGWLLFDDGTFGNSGSGSSNSNSAANLALFTLLFNNLSDTAAPLLTSGGGATTRAAQTNAATAWAALCRMSLPKTLGRALAIAGSGSGLTARALGSTAGTETTTMAQSALPNATLSVPSISVTSTATNVVTGTLQSTGSTGSGGATTVIVSGTGGQGSITSTGSSTTASINGNQAQTSLPLMQPSVFLNAMIKT